MSWLRVLPVVVLVGLAGALAFALLSGNSSSQTDRFVGEPLPRFELEAVDGRSGFVATDLAGTAYLLNVWGSWCPPCEAEHPLLMELADRGIPIYGIAWRDSDENANAFLNRLGNPFSGVVRDPVGTAVIELGVTGAPETFVVDANGIIRARWAGPLTEDVVRRQILPALDTGN
ncbi:MAG: hypothetical protein DHS20C06_03950 [Hyphobacterium sp.]|nr:MAG: hypothetical protein DHS20C06_03950 [Hyphobacterium sp.]